MFVCCKVDGGNFQGGRLFLQKQQYHLGFAQSLEMEKQQNGFRWIRKMIAIWFGYASRGRAMSDARGAPNYGPGRSREPMKGAWKDLRSLLALLDLNVNPSAFAVPSGCLMLFIFWNSDCQVMVLWNMII